MPSKFRLHAARLSLALAALLATTASASGQVVVNNGAPNGQAGFDIFNDFRAADDFNVTSILGFDSIRFWALLPPDPCTRRPSSGKS